MWYTLKDFHPLGGGKTKKGRKGGWGVGGGERHCGNQKNFGHYGGVVKGGLAQSLFKHYLNGPPLTMHKWRVVEMSIGESISLTQTRKRQKFEDNDFK